MAMKIKPAEAEPVAELEEVGATPEAAVEADPEPTNGVLTKAHIASLRTKAKEPVEREITKEAADRFLKEEVAKLRAEHGVGKPSDLPAHLNELVEFTLDLPDSCDGVIQLDIPHGKKYYRGHRYTEPRHRFNDLNWIAFRNALSEQSRKGESVFGNRQPVSMFSKVLSAKA